MDFISKNWKDVVLGKSKEDEKNTELSNKLDNHLK